MYATPATGSSTNKNDLEDYLLGKKRVDKLLTGDENEKVCRLLPDFRNGWLTHAIGWRCAQKLHCGPERQHRARYLCENSGGSFARDQATGTSGTTATEVQPIATQRVEGEDGNQGQREEGQEGQEEGEEGQA